MDNNQYSQGYGQESSHEYRYNSDMMDEMGNPLKSYLALQIVFAVVEIVLCCLSPLTTVLGIVALVFAVQANNAYIQRNAAGFKSKSKVSNILLIIGGVFALLSVAIKVLAVVIFASNFTGMVNDFIIDGTDNFEEFFEYYEEEYNEDFDGLEEDIAVEQTGADNIPLVEGFDKFTLNGVEYSMPMSYATFLEMGYYIEEGYSENYIFAPEYYEYFNIYDGEKYIGMIRVSNDTATEIPLKDASVDYISFENFVADQITFGNGFDLTTSYETLEEWLGGSSYQYIDDETGYVSYQWIYSGDNKYQNFEVTYFDGAIVNIIFEEYDIAN